MKKMLCGIVIGLSLNACRAGQSDVEETRALPLPRVAIAGLAIESSTFSPARTEEEAFHPKTGEEIFGNYPFLAPGSALRARAEWIPTITGRALPGGIVTRGPMNPSFRRR